MKTLEAEGGPITMQMVSQTIAGVSKVAIDGVYMGKLIEEKIQPSVETGGGTYTQEHIDYVEDLISRVKHLPSL